MSTSFNAKVTCVVKKAYAFKRLMRENDFVFMRVDRFDDEEMVEVLDGEGNLVDLVNPPGYEGREKGYKNVPCPGSFRIESVEQEGEEEEQDGATLNDRILNALLQLDPDEDGHWTQERLPRAEVVSALVGQKVTRQEIEGANPTFNRSSAQVD